MLKKRVLPKTQNTSPEPDILKNYLDYYKGLDRPGFAVLVTGAWGSGKTFQVTKEFSADEQCYVSLFGLSSESEVFGAVLAKTNPELANRKKLADWSKDKSLSMFGFGFPVGGALAYAVDVNVRENVDSSKVLVFDDLERCTIDLRILMGIINFYVEHHGCRVVVLAHDEMTEGHFKKAKEKVFGHTIRVIPKTKEAFEFFASELGQNTKKILSDYHGTLLELFALSTCQSLRVLKQALKGTERFCELLTENQIANVGVFKRLLSLYFSLSIEVLRGDLVREDLVDRVGGYVRSQVVSRKSNSEDDAEKQQLLAIGFAESHGRYASALEISSYDISDDLLIQMILDGQYEKARLQEYFLKSQIFEQPAEWAAWRRFIMFDSQPDEFVAQAAKDMDRQFQDREVTDLGEFMQIVSLRIMRVKNGLMNGSVDDIAKDCTKYLDDLVDQKRFPLEPNIEVFGSHPAHGGVMLWCYEENAKFLKDIRDHVLVCEKRSLELFSPDIKHKLFSALEKSPEQFGSLLNYFEDNDAEYQTVPVMLCLPVKEFADAFLKLPVEKWKTMQSVMSKRLGRISSNNSLAEEANWFKEFESEMLKRAEVQSGTINALRIKRHIPSKY